MNQNKKTNIAILGNGQLASMLADCADKLSLTTQAFPLPKTDASGLISQKEIDYWLEVLQPFDVVTFEIENIALDLLKALETVTLVRPAVTALEVAQDRLKEKTLCSQLEIPTNQYLAVSSYNDLLLAVEKLGLPLVIKTRRFGYDGKGQYVIKDRKDIEPAWQALSGASHLIAEQFVPFDFEVSQVATRDKNGQIVFYPLVRNEHRDGILRESFVLSDKQSLSLDAQTIAKKLLDHFDYIGTFAIEFFVKDNQLLVNEIAPRVHNSGHWSINGASVSQFENHLRAISDLSLVQPQLVAPFIMMVNLIGEELPDNWPTVEGVYPKSYGKSLRENRKMGHVNVVGHSKDELKLRLNDIYQQIQAMACLDI
ncbi:5-(carboxyamino)imidazole ribonucleotide synthase [Thiotrichales bacterium 19S3-7]|nr:5-(carboxyamino)imidazole ribonucleotide synthase [Thiotrichales bacterium 19S3-7]MCF6801758.1 5-(carboxyamino)imidazole ribonucleotide synthase [Thiotrichales bacterium 19S3-11]